MSPPFAAWLLGAVVAAASTSCLVAAPERGTPGPVPFEPLAREEAQRLAEKAAWHEDRIGRRHVTAEGLFAYQAATREADDAVTPTAYPDMAIWTGLYLAAESLRYRVTGDEDAVRRMDRVIGGLSLLHQVTQTPGFLARAVQRVTDIPDPRTGWTAGSDPFRDYQWLGDTSVDQVLGVVYGYGWAFDATDDRTRRDRIAREVTAIVDRIVAHGMRIVGPDGRRVKHGDLTDGLLAENLNALIALAVVKTAAHMAPEGPYQETYRDLAERRGYARRAVAARDRWWERFTGVNHSDNNLAVLAYDVLLRYEDDLVLRGRYREGLSRTWAVSRREGNALSASIAASHGVSVDGAARRSAMASLLDFPLEQPGVTRMNSRRPDVCVSPRRDRTGDLQACEPLPMSERPRGPFEWNQNPYRLDSTGDGTQEYSGLGYLVAYWLGRRVEFIGAPSP
jgi:hypothetical protein